ncbi:hypothetical protein EPUL_005146 [Erysiphe pulchra]|uniref:Uncharacterized protein n=1 Tax=Erysiphe pulchra TaxID=225359 RepID=A0A2S4PNW9_9PEZI|nr:hypothetical protein EPUL_005146 [Erysiphe pulchra]
MAKSQNEKAELIIFEGEEFDSDSEFEVKNLDQEIFLNPFHIVGIWTKKLLEGASAESMLKSNVNCYKTQNQKFIAAPIKFSKGSYSSQNIRVDDVMIPYSNENGYGQKYLYICLSNVLEKFITSTFETSYVNLKTAKFQGNEGEWWKTIYDIKDSFHVINKRQKSTPVSIRKIMRRTKKGLRANLILEFSLSTRTNGDNWSCRMETTILVKVISGYITSIGVDIEPPTPIGSVPGKPMPRDTASENILTNLEKFRI